MQVSIDMHDFHFLCHRDRERVDTWTVCCPKLEPIEVQTKEGQIHVTFDADQVQAQRHITDVLLVPRSGKFPVFDFIVAHRKTDEPDAYTFIQVDVSGKVRKGGKFAPDAQLTAMWERRSVDFMSEVLARLSPSVRVTFTKRKWDVLTRGPNQVKVQVMLITTADVKM